MSGQLLGLLIGPFEAFSFMRIALVASFALALANGPIGTLLLMRRESLSGNVLSHAVMPGAALGYLYAGYSLAALSFGGLLTGLVVAGLAAFKTRSKPQAQDASLIAFYLVSLSFGILIVAARGSQADLMHVLFGTVLAVDVNALLLIASITSLTLLIIAALYRPLAVESFDPAFLRTVGGGGDSFARRFRHARGSQSRREFPGLRHVACDRADAATRGRGALLDPESVADDRPCDGDRNRPPRFAGLLISYYSNLPSGPAIVIGAGLIYGISLLATGRMRFKPRIFGEQR